MGDPIQLQQHHLSITVRIKSVYGVETIYPVCERAVLFAQIAGTKTLTRQCVSAVRALGYRVVVEQVSLRAIA